MGSTFAKAVDSVVVKRWGSPEEAFRVGLAEMNGWRPSMEDAHVVFMKQKWGFFGVFDGHGGDQCSAFIAERMTEELEANGMPANGDTLTELALKLDKEYLETGNTSGSTGTFVVVTPPAEVGGRYHLRVGNVGDSRILLGRRDGTMVEGAGSDGAITTDHKPDHPSERARIERTGASVVFMGPVARVNGELAVSRAFGDGSYKETGGPSQLDHPVIAAPEIIELECESTDFIVLVCDGISEGDFPNREVVQLAAAELQKAPPGGAPGAVDLGAACAAICRRALARDSKDNLSCMIVLLGGGEVAGRKTELHPGSVHADVLRDENKGYRKAFEAMAGHAGMTLAQAIEARYDLLLRYVNEPPPPDAVTDNWREELEGFGDGPPRGLAPGSEERTQWFASWAEDMPGPSGGGGAGELTSEGQEQAIRRMIQLGLAGGADAQGLMQQLGAARRPPAQDAAIWEPAIAAEAAELQAAIDAHSALKWDDKYLQCCGKEGRVLERDPGDNTSQVNFILTPGNPLMAWFPNESLRPPKARLTDKGCEHLKRALEEIGTEWDAAKHGNIQEGVIVKIDHGKSRSSVKFPELDDEMLLWLPNDMLVRID